MLALLAPGRALAGEPPRPRPRVEVTQDHLLSTSSVVRGKVDLILLYGRHLAANAGDVRFVPLDGSVPATVVVDHERYELRANASGTFAARVESPTHPELPAAELRVRVMASSDRVAVVFRLRRPGPDAMRGRWLSIEQGEFRMADAIEVHHDEARAELVPGEYTLVWHADSPFGMAGFVRRANVRVGPTGGVVSAVFDGSRVSFKPDYFPDSTMYQLVIEHDDGNEDVFGLYEVSALPQLLSADVAPGNATLILRETPHFSPWSPPRERSAWVERRRERIAIAPASSLTVEWSMPRLFAGVDPKPGPWQDLPGLAPAVLETPRRPDLLTADHGALAWFEHDRVRTFFGTFVSFTPGHDLRPIGPGGPIAALDPTHFAWTSDQSVFYLTPHGVSSETLPTYAEAPGTPSYVPSRKPYPCRANAVAAPAADLLVVVGQCGDSPLSGSSPPEGFLAERDRERWHRLPDRPPPLHAAASDQGTVVAVGDAGTVLWRRAGHWTRETRGLQDYLDVGFVGGHVFARTRRGDVVDLATPSTPLPAFEVPDGMHPIHYFGARAMCVTRRGPVAWFGAYRSEFSSVPSRVALWEGGHWRVLFEPSNGTDVEAVACDDDVVRLVTAGADARALLTVTTTPTPVATVVWSAPRVDNSP